MARLTGLFLLCLIVPIVLSQCTKEKAKENFKRAVYDFSIELMSRVAENSEGHFIASPLSVWNLLSILAMGASDNTLAEIKRVAGLHPHECFNKKYLELVKEIAVSDSQATIERSSSLFVDNTMGLKQNFQKRLTKSGFCDITPLSFDDFAAAAAEINNFVREATHGIVDEIVSANDMEGVYLILIDAIYFKGAWRNSFPIEDTETNAFYDSKTVQIGDVNTMYMTGQFNITYIPKIEAKVLELPYGTNGKFSMLVFLPQEHVTVQKVIEDLENISLRSIFAKYSKHGPLSVSVTIPRFKISSDLFYLKDLLIDMGLKEMFDSVSAKFPALSHYALHVSNFIQKADIEVTEEGTVSAAATQAGLAFRTLPMEFLANKPFFFMVVDRQAEVPIFTGAYSKPSLF